MRRFLFFLLAVVLVIVALGAYASFHWGGELGRPKGGVFPSLEDRGAEATKGSHEPISFSTRGLDVKITKEIDTPTQQLQGLLDRVRECGPTIRPAGYFSELTASFQDAKSTVYIVSSKETAQSDTTRYYITVLPNTPGYTDTFTFKEDFSSCQKGPKPVALSPDWLVFVEGCEGVETNVCRDMRSRVEPTIHIK